MAEKDVRLDISEQQCAEFLRTAEAFADEARDVISRTIGTKLSVEAKADKSLVTKADTDIEAIFREKVQKFFPRHGVIGEEFGSLNPQAEYQWIFDPIDGTEEFVHGVPTFGTVIGLHYQGKPLIGVIDHPALSIRTSAGYGLGVFTNGAPNEMLAEGDDIPPGEERVVVSKPKNFLYLGDELSSFTKIMKAHPKLRVFDSCFAYTTTVSGGTDLMFDWNTSIWDFSPCQVMIEELGGKFISVARPVPEEEGKIRYCSIFGKPSLVDRAKHLLPGPVKVVGKRSQRGES